MVPLSAYVAVSAVLFITGLLGVLIRRNFIIVLMAVEIMLNAANINLVAFSHYLESGGPVGGAVRHCHCRRRGCGRTGNHHCGLPRENLHECRRNESPQVVNKLTMLLIYPTALTPAMLFYPPTTGCFAIITRDTR